MFIPRSIFSLHNWVRLAERGAVSWRSTKRQRLTRPGGLRLEILEDRTLLSTWVPKAPAPILNGAPWGDPASGRIVALAAHPRDPNTIYIAAAGGGVAEYMPEEEIKDQVVVFLPLRG
jgi:hypothetical protein